jgi:two-component system chemotaxis response regulator CheB
MELDTIIVIGTSAGGVSALQALFGALPGDLPAAIFVVLHIGAHKSQLPSILSRAGQLPVVQPRDGDPIQAGYIYVAPPDQHMILKPGRIHLTKGPRENWARPAIDPLFRSAAQAYGNRVVGVILTGGLNDGTAGLYEIKASGGTTMVQDPDDAVDPGMPLSAIRNVAIDYCLPLPSIPAVLVRLAAEHAFVAPDNRELAMGQGGEMTAEYTMDRPVTVTCPDCGGALRQSQMGSLTQFSCHIGHVYTAEVMIVAQFLALERSIEMTLRSLNERAELCRRMAELSKASAGKMWSGAMQEAKEAEAPIRALLEKEWLHPVPPSDQE